MTTNKQILISLDLQINSLDEQITNLMKIRNDLFIKYSSINSDEV